jgi:preprotein translocase subunit SecA
VGTASIDKNEVLSALFTEAGIPHEMLNAKNHEREGEIIAQAGVRGRVTLATNMAGRGVDIKLGGTPSTPEMSDEVKALGGLFVLGTERHEARRIDNQLRGRAGRQGDQGETQFFVSMEDPLMRVFAGDAVKNMMGRFGIPEDQPIENRLITRSLESAQERIEGFNFDARKHVLAYDDVLNKQRVAIYERRRKLLVGSHEEVDVVMNEVVASYPEVAAVISERKANLGDEGWYTLGRRLVLQILDALWVEHLELMDYTRSSVNLRAYGQRDPLIEYRKEGNRLFIEMQAAFLGRIAEFLPKVVAEALAREEAEQKAAVKRMAQMGAVPAAGSQEAPRGGVVSEQRPNRNDVVTITNGTETRELKYKKAEELLSSGAWKIVA